MLPQQYQQQTQQYLQQTQPSSFSPFSPFSPSELPSQSRSSLTTASFRRPSTTAKMPQEFHRFLLLPPEIRTMVWEYALPEPRVYEVMDVPNAKQKMNAADGLMFANVHHEPPPPLAAVCQEGRSFVLHHYRPLTLGRTTKYVDLSRDLLLLEPYLLLKRLHRTLHFMSRIPLIRDHMAGLALGTSYGVYTGICHPVLSWKVSKSNMGKLLTGLAKFPKLKALLFVVHQEFQFEFDYCCPPAPGLTASRTTPPPHPLLSHPSHPPPGPGTYSTYSLPSGMTGLQQTPPQQSASPYASPSSSSASPSPSPLPSPVAPHQRYPPTIPEAFQQQPQSYSPVQLPLPPVPPMNPAPSPRPYISRPLHSSSTTQQDQSPASPPVIHQAQVIPAPQPAAPQALRPQVVHQAYRFKFDIEGNINRHPRRPHLNQLLFYPLEDKGEVDEKDDWEALLNAKSVGGPDDYDEEDPFGEFFDPWPSNEDWRRFRQRFRRQVVATLQAGLATGESQNAFCVDADMNEATSSLSRVGCGSGTGASASRSSGNGLSSSSDKKYQQYLHQRQQKCGSDDYDSGYNGPSNYNNMYSLHGSSNYAGVQKNGDVSGHRRRYSLKHKLPAIKGASLLWRYTRGE